MHYEHLVEINHPGLPQLALLTRQQLWQGLLLRVEQPGLFLPHLDRAHCEWQAPTTLKRELVFGSVLISDQVQLIPKEQLDIAITAPAEHAGSLLVIRIEEPEPERLFLRFSYSTRLEDEEAIEYVKSAYRDADIDSVRIMRQWLAEQH